MNAEAADVDEQRKIAEGADALLNLAGVSTTPPRDPLAPDEEEEEDELAEEEEEDEYEDELHRSLYGSNRNAPRAVPGSDPLEIMPVTKRRNSGDGPAAKRRKRPWRDAWNESARYIKQVRG